MLGTEYGKTKEETADVAGYAGVLGQQKLHGLREEKKPDSNPKEDY